MRSIVIARDLSKTFPLHHHRVLSLKGNPRHSTVQRIYAGLNLAF